MLCIKIMLPILFYILSAALPSAIQDDPANSQAALNFLEGNFSYEGTDHIAGNAAKGTAHGKFEYGGNWLCIKYSGYWDDVNYMRFNPESGQVDHYFFGNSGDMSSRHWKLAESGVLISTWKHGATQIEQHIEPTKSGFKVNRWITRESEGKTPALELFFNKELSK